MGRAKLPKNKKFSYTPRYYDDKGQGNPFEIKHKFDAYRTTVGSNLSLKSKFTNALNDLKTTPTARLTSVFLLLLAYLF